MYLTPTTSESSRGKDVLIVFKKSVDHAPLEGRLYNIDPKSGTVFLHMIDENTQDESLEIILNDAIESIESA